jgi:sugar diacid utilization regulator
LGHEIDDVRRESICDRRTPEQWVTRFTEDNSAYRTFQSAGTVIRVDGYDDLRTRLRIAVESNGEILGELSVAEGSNPLDERAEEALRTAAQLASPLMLRYKRATEDNRIQQRRLLLRILHDSDAAVKHAPELGLRLRDKWLLIGLQLNPPEGTAEAARHIVNERAARLLSMQLSFVDTSPTVFYDQQTFYVLLPVSTDKIHTSLMNRLEILLTQLAKIGMHGYAAVGAVSDDLRSVPIARADVDRLLRIGLQKQMMQAVLTIEETWAERSMLNMNDALGQDIERDCPPLAKLSTYDEEHSSDFVPTLVAYMEEFGSISAAAERLFIHQNTLRHRLHRIVEISGIDFANPTQWLVVNCFLHQVGRTANEG